MTTPDLTSEHMPGTRRNPMPGATREEVEAARVAWAAADPLTQAERNDAARLSDWAIEHDLCPVAVSA